MPLAKGNKQIYFKLHEKLIEELDEIADEEYMTRSQLVERLVIDFIKEKRKENKKVLDK
jgi:metal-responsive CopG/Arc/MetJ family transcriptional regulator